MKLVSIIIPVYNQAPYLRECIDSVLEQDYNNLQIILVDDGSTDGSSDICDEYAKKNNNIEVIHKSNGGLSSARNAGLKLIKGDYVSFVDSDDWIDGDMISYLVTGLENDGCDISICGLRREKRFMSVRMNPRKKIIMDKDEAIVRLVYDKTIQNYVWNKLYRADIVRDVEFPEGMIFEDIGTTYRYFLKSKKIVLLPESKYHYRLNKNGIVKNKSKNGNLQGLIQIIKRFDDLKEYGNYKAHFLMFDGFLVDYIKKSEPEDDPMTKELLEEVIDFIIGNYSTVFVPNYSIAEKKLYDEIYRRKELVSIDGTHLLLHNIKSWWMSRWSHYINVITRD